MVYAINYENGVNEVFGKVEKQERDYVLSKLYEVARAEFREPWEWDYRRISTHPAGARLRVGDELRVFVDVDQSNDVIEVHEAVHRENLY